MPYQETAFRAVDAYAEVLRDIIKYGDQAYQGARGHYLSDAAHNCGYVVERLASAESSQYPRTMLSLDAAKRVFLFNVPRKELCHNEADGLREWPGFQYMSVRDRHLS